MRYINVLGFDEELSTIFIQSADGSILLDVIPDALEFLHSKPQYKQAYLQDYFGVGFLINQNSTIESAYDAWQAARNTTPASPPASASPMQPIPENLEMSF